MERIIAKEKSVIKRPQMDGTYQSHVGVYLPVRKTGQLCAPNAAANVTEKNQYIYSL